MIFSNSVRWLGQFSSSFFSPAIIRSWQCLRISMPSFSNLKFKISAPRRFSDFKMPLILSFVSRFFECAQFESWVHVIIDLSYFCCKFLCFLQRPPIILIHKHAEERKTKFVSFWNIHNDYSSITSTSHSPESAQKGTGPCAEGANGPDELDSLYIAKRVN